MNRIDPYRQLISRFLSNDIDVSTFETEYLKAFKSETEFFHQPAYEILNDLFGDVDALCIDPSIRSAGDIDEDQLRVCCRRALTKLNDL